MKVIILLLSTATLLGLALAAPAPQKKQDFTLKLQPELDSVNIEDYLRNDRLVDLQLKCILDKAPCDTVGRWLKPRVGAALTGTCLMCTDKQKIGMEKVLLHIQEKRPEQYRESVVKYLKDAGISVPESTPKST
ncbi:Ejaculatory bulb-specific protein 3 [Orchesella cincta]|uniref:Ejaculatory bulb-specific protein 3 n=1 Tax=Orchesella cincta TaxID=48709 RepID=A0A1D2MWX6_ORCCI|nr:Ejaculatory bulb-specific protein 3 [Orchesella cincta]